MEITIKDIDASNIDDVFKVCSHDRLKDPLQKRGIDLKRRWLTRMLEEHGPCTKIAYLDGRPVAQILYYPEAADPTVAEPRDGVMAIHCTYNPFRETQKKGVSSRLLESVLKECRDGPRSLGGKPARFAVAQAFEAGEGTSLVNFYASKGFRQGEGEMYLELSGLYEPRKPASYEPLPEDQGRSLVFYDPVCEWGVGFTVGVEGLINEIAPDLPVTRLNSWERPNEYIRRGGKQVIVNAKPIESFWTERAAFRREVEEALLA